MKQTNDHSLNQQIIQASKKIRRLEAKLYFKTKRNFIATIFLGQRPAPIGLLKELDDAKAELQVLTQSKL